MDNNRSNESNLKDIFRFDTRNSRELTPYLVFSDVAYSYFSKSNISKVQKFFTHDEFITEMISNLGEKISSLFDLSDILFKNKKSFIFSPSMVNSSLKKLDSILNTLCLIQKFEFVSKPIYKSMKIIWNFYL